MLPWHIQLVPFLLFVCVHQDRHTDVSFAYALLVISLVRG